MLVGMNIQHSFPPFGTRFGADVSPRGSRFRARVRWTDPATHQRRSRSITVESESEAEKSSLSSCVRRSTRPWIR